MSVHAEISRLSGRCKQLTDVNLSLEKSVGRLMKINVALVGLVLILLILAIPSLRCVS